MNMNSQEIVDIATPVLARDRFYISFSPKNRPETVRVEYSVPHGQPIQLDISWNHSHFRKGSFDSQILTTMCGVCGSILQKDNDNIYIVTDTYGMLPVYFYRGKNGFCFFTHFPDFLSSMSSPSLTPDPTGISEAMFFDIFINGRTIFKEIQMLPQGSIICWNSRNSELSITPYYNYSFDSRKRVTETDVGEQIAERLENVLRKTYSDHFLLPLSGGVDSRLLAAAMTRVYGPENITALSFAAHPKSYECVYAKEVCEILGIKDWQTHILTPDSYMRSLKYFPERFGGNLSVAHGHLFDGIKSRERDFKGMTLVSGAFADAVGGYGAKAPGLEMSDQRDSHYYRHLIKLDAVLDFKSIKNKISDDIEAVFIKWKNGSSVETFDEYAYITQRQPCVLFTQSLLYKDVIPVMQPFADYDLSEFFFGLPYELRSYKKATRAAIHFYSQKLSSLADVSSKMISDSFRDTYRVYRGKVMNNACRIMTTLTNDRRLFFSPYQTESQDYNLRTSHREMAINAMTVLRDYGIIRDDQLRVLTRKPYKQFGGGVMPCAQYWAITITEALKRFAG